MFGAVLAADGSSPEALALVAREFSPRIEMDSAVRPPEVVLDLSGLARLFGDARTMGDAMRRTAADRGLRVRVAMAGTRTAARLMVRHRAGVTCLAPGTEAAALAGLPIRLLVHVASDAADADDLLATFLRWGVRTLGELAALPRADVAARMGQAGARWQALARGEDAGPLVPAVPDERFEQAFDLEWPIDGIEPLSFVLGRLMEPLAAHLARRGRAAAVLRVRLHLVTREVHERSLDLPAPMHDARTLRTLALLDLESHPPAAAIDRVVVSVEPTPARPLQYSLLVRPLPPPAQIATLMARLSALVGEGWCGSPADVDSWRPGACAMKPFAPVEARASVSPRDVSVTDAANAHHPVVAFRRLRTPVPVRVRVAQGRPVHVIVDRRSPPGGPVEACAGPWRSSGEWWATESRSPSEAPPRTGEHGAPVYSSASLGGSVGLPRSARRAALTDENLTHERGFQPVKAARSDQHPWDHDEWDVTLSNGPTIRLYHDRATNAWFLEGVVD